jgi:hypothetical protein
VLVRRVEILPRQFIPRKDVQPSLFLLIGDTIAASNVQHVIESAVPLNPKTTESVALRLARADAGRVGAAARRGVRVLRGGERDGEERGEEVELHVESYR